MGGAVEVNDKMKIGLLERKARRPKPGTKKTPFRPQALSFKSSMNHVIYHNGVMFP